MSVIIVNQIILKKLVLVFISFIALGSFSQNKYFEISGQVVAADSMLPLESATVYLEREKDSTVITYTISDADGKFYSKIQLMMTG